MRILAPAIVALLLTLLTCCAQPVIPMSIRSTTNTFQKQLTFSWRANTETNLAFYILRHYVGTNRVATHYIAPPLTNFVLTASQTNRNSFTLTAIDTAQLESPPTLPLFWPEPLLAVGTNNRVVVELHRATHLDGPWARVNVITNSAITNAIEYYKSYLRIERY